MRWTVLVALWGCADAGGAPEAGNTRERLDSAETRIDELEADLSAAQARIRVLEERTASGDLPDPPKYQRGEVIAEVKCDEVTGPWFDLGLLGEAAYVVVEYPVGPDLGPPPVVWSQRRTQDGWSAWSVEHPDFAGSAGPYVAATGNPARGVAAGDLVVICKKDADDHVRWTLVAP